jgi:predicted PhzF superfamily epimerase YddE/YHI9
MEIPIYQVDAFAGALFRGNPAAVCPLEAWLPEHTLQAIAAENNLSETAFYVRENGRYRIRWFTPSVEVELCGHATLASAAVILGIRREIDAPRVVFDSRSGELGVDRDGDLYKLDFPARPPVPCAPDPALIEAMGGQPAEALLATDAMLVYHTEEEVRALKPDMSRLARLPYFATIATAPGSDCDFVSRFFAPSKGIPEDPVTGRAHTTLIPFWAGRLGKRSLFARQLSPRGGELWCEDRGNRVTIGGRAVKYLEGRICLPD